MIPKPCFICRRKSPDKFAACEHPCTDYKNYINEQSARLVNKAALQSALDCHRHNGERT